jgi:TonB-dependent receptor
MNTRTRIRFIFALMAALGCASALPVQAGTIAGRVTDEQTKLSLGGTRVTVAGTDLTTYADRTGGYNLANVPAGAQTIEFSYVGYPALRLPVTVGADGTVTLNAGFGGTPLDTVRMEAVTITGDAVGQARAINQQRAATTLSNFVAADEIGRFPDQNAAESMQRIPGLALYRDQGEGRFIVVRGIRPDLNSVKINGVAMASPERGDRTIALDVLPSDALAAIEVTKVPTPDMDADGLGGSINVKTKSAFDGDGQQLQFTAQGQFNNLRDRYSSKLSLTAGSIFNDGKVGVIFSPTWQERRFGSNNFEEAGGWAQRAVPGSGTGQTAFFFNEAAFREYEITRHRYGANAAIELKPDHETYFYLRGTFSKFNDHENRYVLDLPFSEGTLTALTDTSATVTGVRRERHDLRFRTKLQEVWNVVAGAEKTIGAWQLDGRVALGQGNEERPGETTVRFRKSTRGTDWTYSFADGTYAPVMTVTGAGISNPALYNEISRFRVVNSPGSEKETNVGGNARYDFALAGRGTGFLKVGAQLRQKDKVSENETTDYAVPASFTFAAMSEPQGPNDYPFLSSGLRGSTPKIQAAMAAGGFTPTRLFAESTQDDWKSTEDVAAGYVMGGATVGPLNAIAGVRYESTEYNNAGNEVTGATAKAVSRGRTYTNYLPGAYLRYDLNPQTILRASWSNSLARPSFDDSALRRSVDLAASRATEGNPGLKPLESSNLDASLERYFPSLGMFSAAYFRKDIENFTYQNTIPGGDPATGFALVTYVNGNKGRISGLELAWQQQLRFLPAPFDGLGVMVNYTRTDSEATYPTRPGETLDFIGQSKEIGNAALTFEKRGFFVRASVNFRSPRLREDEPLGPDATTDRWVDDTAQIDVNTSYRINKNWEIFAEALNLSNEPFRVYFAKNGTRLAQFEEYGWSANFGVRWRQ